MDDPVKLGSGLGFNTVVSSLAAILGLFSTGFGVWVTIDNQTIKRAAEEQSVAIRKVEADLKLTAERRAERALEHAQYIAIYEKAVLALKGGTPREQAAALGLISVLPDSVFKTELARAFVDETAVANTETRTAAKEIYEQSQFKTEQSQVQGSARAWDYDVFWCEDAPNAKDIARRVFDSLSQPGFPHGRVRVRSLPKSVNQGAGYRIRENTVQAEPGERTEAELVRARVAAAANVPFSLSASEQPTRWYLSVFVCAGAQL